MKQNERLLIYAVSGFLALILVVAVVFGHNPPVDGGLEQTGVGASGVGASGVGASGVDANRRGPAPIQGAPASGAMGLTDILGASNGNPAGANPSAAGAKAGAAENRTGLPGPEQVNNERLAAGGQPLVAASKPLVAAEVVTQALGPNRRDRNVRFVRARSGDSLDLLVRRWCGARDPFLAEAKSLNEDLVLVRVGQEVAVPYVEDEVLMATLDAPKRAPMPANDPVAANPVGTASAAELGSLLGTKVPSASPANPSFAVPGAEVPSAAVPGRGAPVEASASRGVSYLVKSGDSLWKIAERTYGRQQADRMIPVIKDANPGLTDTVRIGQKIVLPKTAP